MLNKIIIMGRFVDNVELRSVPDGTPVASFTIACQRDVTSKSGERVTDFIPVVAWSKTAEFVSKHFGKGSMAVVSGRLRIRDWTDKDGNKRRTAEVIAQDIYFGESKKTHTGDSAANGGASRNNSFVEIEDDGDIPF